MAQHGRLVVSCTGTLHLLPAKQTTSALCVRTEEVVGAQMWESSTRGQGWQLLWDYSACSLSIIFIPLSDKVVKLHLDLHMQLAQG